MAELKLILLKNAAIDYGHPFEMLVAARDDDQARMLAARHVKAQGFSTAYDWIAEEITTATHIGSGVPGTEPGVIITKESAS